MYINTHSCYSFRYGTMRPKEIIPLGISYGINSMALTDINSTSACMDFIRLAQKEDFHPVVGVDFRNGVQQLFIALAKNGKGFLEINTYLSKYLHNKTNIPAQAPEFEHVWVIYPWANYSGHVLRDFEYVGVCPQDLSRLRFVGSTIEPKKLTALTTVSFRNKRDFNAHRLLRAIANNTLLSKLSKSEEGSPVQLFYTPQQLRHLYAHAPFLLNKSQALLESCELDFGFGQEADNKNLKTYTGSLQGDAELVRQLCNDGLNYRYPGSKAIVRYRIEKELEIIIEKGFLSYFLINWDIVRYARSKSYFYVGRGSGANSIIAYLLRITDVDPIELDLYFERFINLYRQNPPDFDIDFSWTDRDDITNYIFDKYPNSALLATYNTFQYRAVVRELGKVFGLPKFEIDILSKGKFDLRKLDSLNQLVLRYSSLIQDLPSHLSIHAGGILIPERDIHCYTATFMPPKGFPTTQFDMVVAEDVGLYKFDILSQRGLGKIKDALSLIKENHPKENKLDIHNIAALKEDEGVKSLLRDGKAIGCFYVESPAMRMLLKKLRVDSYLGLVAASSIIRPGVAKSGMMREYIRRFREPARRKDAHPVMLELMPETYGVMVYQEDVIKVAHYFAGLSLGEADMLRRGMSGKFRSRAEFQKVKQQFFDNCREIGHEDQLAAEVWRQIESFAGYAFAKGHSASYAVESYQSLYLKYHYPLEYMVATINNFGGFYHTELYVHEARMHGASIMNPCINKSRYLSTIYERDIYLGFILVRELEASSARRIEEERYLNGFFTSLDDFLDRVALNFEQLVTLVRVDAFRFTGKHRRELLWDLHLKFNKNDIQVSATLFRPMRKQWDIPQLSCNSLEDVFDEMELVGFPVTQTPFNLLVELPKNTIFSADWAKYSGKTVESVGYLVNVKNTKTAKGKRMNFGCFLDERGDFLDTVHFPPVAARYPFRGRGFYKLKGKIMEEFGFYSMEVSAMKKLDIIQDPRYAEDNKYAQLKPST